jgi:hypothetical protein
MEQKVNLDHLVEESTDSPHFMEREFYGNINMQNVELTYQMNEARVNRDHLVQESTDSPHFMEREVYDNIKTHIVELTY